MRAGAGSPTSAQANPPHTDSVRLFIEHRATPRVIIPGGLASFSSLEGEAVEGDAVLLNVSFQGCQIRSETEIRTDHLFQIIFCVPQHQSPILVQKAIARWNYGDVHGFQFVALDSSAELRIKQVIEHSPPPSWVLSSMRFSTWPVQSV